MQHFKTNFVLLTAFALTTLNAPVTQGALRSAGNHSSSRQHLLNVQFVQAANTGNLPRLKQLLAQGASVESTQQNSWTALMVAVLNNNLPVVQYLLAHGANPNRHTRYYNDDWPLQQAAENGNIPIAKALLHHGAKINDHDVSGNTALMMAIDPNIPPARMYHMVQFLLHHGAKINARSLGGETALSFATGMVKQFPQYVRVVRLLKRAGGHL